jgi:hypothetical protein
MDANILDPDVVRTSLAHHLVSAASHIVSCRVARYRHRPGDRSVVQYVVHVRDGRGHVSEERVTGQWHTEPGRTSSIHDRLAKRAIAGSLSWHRPFAPVFFDQTLGMLATTFPFDRRLTALSQVASGSAQPVVAAMLRSIGASPEGVANVEVTPIRYREQLNAVCRYVVQTGQNDGASRAACFYAKVYGDDRGAGTARLLLELARATEGPGSHARVQTPVTYDVPLRTLVVSAAPGQPMDAIELRDAAAVDEALVRVASALAAFSRRQPQLPDEPVARSRVAACARSIRAITDGLPSDTDAVRTLASWLEAHLRDCRVGLVHGDLKLEHVFLDGQVVWLIDVDSAHMGDPLWDLALLQARWWSARDANPGGRAIADHGWDALEAAYLPRVPETWPKRLPPLQVAALLDVAAGTVKRREPDWRARSDRLIRQALGIASAPR